MKYTYSRDEWLTGRPFLPSRRLNGNPDLPRSPPDVPFGGETHSQGLQNMLYLPTVDSEIQFANSTPSYSGRTYSPRRRLLPQPQMRRASRLSWFSPRGCTPNALRYSV